MNEMSLSTDTHNICISWKLSTCTYKTTKVSVDIKPYEIFTVYKTDMKKSFRNP